MKYVKNLLRNNIASLKGKKWYHQRFDGSPYLIHIIAENELRDEKRKRKSGGVHTTRVCFFNNDRADWYLLMDDIEKTTRTMLELAKKDPSISRKLLKDWEKDEQFYYTTCEDILKTDLASLSTPALIKLHNAFYLVGSRRFTSSSIIDGFALGSDEIIAKMIMDFLRQKGLKDNFPQIFSKLTAPVKQSFINEAEISLLKVAKLIEENEELRGCITKTPKNKIKRCIDMLKNFPDINERMQKHIKRWHWSKNNYVQAYHLDEEHWLEEIKEMLEHDLNIEEQIEKISTTPDKNKLVKMELMKKLQLPTYIKTLLIISEDLTWWQDERKKATYLNANCSTGLLNEIGKRTGFRLHELKYMSVDEVSAVLKNPPTKNEISKRMKDCAFFWLNDKHECITGNDIENLRIAMFGKLEKKNITEFTGLCASVGKVIGNAKICKSSTEVGKVEKGDILVAIMTRPDYVIGMKKAAAIVTNEGGVTSHAAIVSRELGIPCVIGTKIATEVLKDGDLIEVNANEGIVKKIEQVKINETK